MMHKYRSVADMVAVDKEGWLRGRTVRQIPCANHNDRPDGTVIDSVVIHCISLPERNHDPRLPIDLFLNRIDAKEYPKLAPLNQLKVSAHFMIDRAGIVMQFVSVLDRAWHAGVSSAMERADFNDFSVGIELLGDVYSPYTPAQLSSLTNLLNVLRQRYPLKYAFAHSEIAPTRKQDPGQFFPWQRFRKAHNFELDL
ncbi:MAG: 1,6-anhydro-N-acetylmuramyl-L-alanine amidase AmpD [Limnobacter sp.]|nr:1,6-anhydro-N-acetylmuramyl-L-alanine amidase AmpD [Limnobacter sp.]